MRIPFVGPAYRSVSLNINAQRCVNFRLEAGGPDAKAPMNLVGTDGLTRLVTLPNAPCEVRGQLVFDGNLWVVGGNKVYKVSPAFVPTEMGTIGTSNGPVSMSANRTQLILVDGGSGYVYDKPTTTFAAITDPEFPAGARRVSYVAACFLVEDPESEQFSISAIGDGRAWDGLDFASAEGAPDNITSHIVSQLEVWILGQSTTEIFRNTGNASFPLERNGTAFIETGIAAAFGTAKVDNSLIWLGQDDRGHAQVWRARDYTPVIVSTPALEFAFSQYARLDDAIAFAYEKNGTAFFVLIFPTANATWVYDVSLGQWFEWLYFDSSRGEFNRHRANCFALFAGKHVVGDWENGKLYALDSNAYTDDGDTILSLRTSQTLAEDQVHIFYTSLQVDVEAGVGLADGQGVDPRMMLRYSNDSGHSWSAADTASIGRIGGYDARAMWWRLGTGRNRVWEISISDPVKRVIIGAYATLKKGRS